MEPDIHSTLPEGSPLLAYGTSRESRFKDATWLLAIGAGVLVGLTLIIGTILVMTRNVALPKDIVAIAVVPKNVDFPSGFPRTWREAHHTPSVFPTILGVAKDNNTYVPFALTPTLSWKSGFFKLTSETSLEAPVSLSVYRLALRLRRGSNAPYLEIRDSGENLKAAPVLSGTIKNNVWSTSLEAPTTIEQELPSQDVAINVSAFPESFEPIAQALEERVTGISAIPRPDTLGWSEVADGAFSLELGYSAGIPAAARTIFAAAAGNFITKPFHLPDETVVEEIVSLSDATNPVTTTTASLVETQTSIRLGESIVPTSTNEVCGESLLGRFRGNALLLIVERLNVPFVISPDTTLLIGKEKGKVVVCWK